MHTSVYVIRKCAVHVKKKCCHFNAKMNQTVQWLMWLIKVLEYMSIGNEAIWSPFHICSWLGDTSMFAKNASLLFLKTCIFFTHVYISNNNLIVKRKQKEVYLRLREIFEFISNVDLMQDVFISLRNALAWIGQLFIAWRNC